MARVSINMKTENDSVIDIISPTPGAAITGVIQTTEVQQPPGQIFDVTAYGALGNGTADDSLKIRDAFTAAHNYAASGGIASVYFPPNKTYRINTSWNLPAIRTSDWYGKTSPTVVRSGMVWLWGYNATIKFDTYSGTDNPRLSLVQIIGSSSDYWKTFGKITIAGFTFDNNNRSVASNTGTIIMTSGQNINVVDITIKDCKTINVPSRTAYNSRKTINGILINSRPEAETTRGTNPNWNFIENIYVDNCTLQAQNCPCEIMCNGTGAMVTAGKVPIVVDNIHVTNCSTDNRGHIGSAIHLGGYGSGKRAYVENCTCTDSTDNLVEFDAFDYVYAKNIHLSKAAGGCGGTWFSLPYSAPTPPTLYFENVHYTGGSNPYWDTSTTTKPPDMSVLATGWTVLERDQPNWSGLMGVSWGNFTWKNCQIDQSDLEYEDRWAPPLMLDVPFTSATFDGCVFNDKCGNRLATARYGNGQAALLYIGNRNNSSAATVTVKNCTFNMYGDNASSTARKAYAIFLAGRINGTIQDNTITQAVNKTSTGSVTQTFFGFGDTDSTEYTNVFDVDITGTKAANTPGSATTQYIAYVHDADATSDIYLNGNDFYKLRTSTTLEGADNSAWLSYVRWGTNTNPGIGGATTGYYNAMDSGCHNDGSTDDTAHLNAAAAAAKAAGKDLYLPQGSGYYISSQYWTPPSGLRIFGDGVGSWIKGSTRFVSNTSFEDLFMGRSDVSSMELISWTEVQNVTFEHCKFRGGYGTNNTGPTFCDIDGGGFKASDITIHNCGFECPDQTYNVGGTAHAVKVMTDPRYGGTMKDWVIEDCVFGLPNEYGNKYTRYGWIIFYQNVWDWYEGTSLPQYWPTNGWHNNIYITHNHFNHSQQWGIDIANSDGTNVGSYWDEYPYCRFYINDNVFEGAGWNYSDTSGPEYTSNITFESGHTSEVARNVFKRARRMGKGNLNITKQCHYMNVHDNIFDYRADQTETIIPSMYDGDGMYTYGIRDTGSRHDSIRNNTLYLPTTFNGINYQNKGLNQSWIAADGTAPYDYTKTGNLTVCNDTKVDYDNYLGGWEWSW